MVEQGTSCLMVPVSVGPNGGNNYPKILQECTTSRSPQLLRPGRLGLFRDSE
jgi:hypothetical protein